MIIPRVATSLGAAGVDGQRRLREVVRRGLAGWSKAAAAQLAPPATAEVEPPSGTRLAVPAAVSLQTGAGQR